MQNATYSSGDFGRNLAKRIESMFISISVRIYELIKNLAKRIESEDIKPGWIVGYSTMNLAKRIERALTTITK